MGRGVRSMSWRVGGFRDGLMLRVWQRIFLRGVAGIFQMIFAILTRPGFYGSFFPTFFFGDTCLAGIPCNKLPAYKINGYRGQTTWKNR